jgi:hypothetical protein
MKVATWLLRGISDALYDEIQIPHYEPTFADDLWNALKTTCQPRHVHHDLKTWKAFTDIGASDYTSLEAYTAAYSDVYFQVREAGSRPDPYALILDFPGRDPGIQPALGRQDYATTADGR